MEAVREAQDIEETDPQRALELEYESLSIWNTCFAKSKDPKNPREPIRPFPNYQYLREADTLFSSPESYPMQGWMLNMPSYGEHISCLESCPNA